LDISVAYQTDRKKLMYFIETGDNAASQPQIDVTMASPETSPSNERKTSSPALSLTAEHQALAERVLDMVLVMQNARPFLKPVDPEAARAPDYHKVIKRPIDLGTIKKRLRTRLLGISPPTPYASLQEFVDDVELVFDNCFRYNGVVSLPYTMSLERSDVSG
jgi:bromodomain-containing factor 1